MTLEEIKQKEPFFGKWTIVEKLGAGSYGDVYKIKKCDYNGTEYFSALKVISLPKDEDERAEIELSCGTVENIREFYEDKLKNLQTEIELMSQFKGKTNIVSYEDHEIVPKTGEPADGFDVFVRMELLEDLRYIQLSRPALLNNQIEIIRIGKDICTALEVCRSHYIIHRDIKPGNIMRSKDGDYKLGDFGVAKSLENVQSMTRVGTLSYMAPEVEQGKMYDARADIYSLGMVLYESLNGSRGPFLPTGSQKLTATDKQMARERCLRGDQIPLPSRADPRLGEVVRKACAFDPEERYATARLFKAALELAEKQLLGLTPQQPTPSTVLPAPSVQPRSAQNPMQTAPVPVRKEETKKKSTTGVLIVLIILTFAILSLLGVCIYGKLNGWFDQPSYEREENDAADGRDSEEEQDSETENVKETQTETVTGDTQTDDLAVNTPEDDTMKWGGNRVLGSSSSSDLHRYVIVEADVTWKEAFENSQSYTSGYLVHIDSQEEFDAIINLIEQEGYGSDSDETYFFWIGGRRYNVETDYYWVDVEGNRIGDSLNDEPYWLSNEPSFESDGETERYMNMFYTEKSGYIWNDVPNDLVELSSYYSGRIAYIVEIED